MIQKTRLKNQSGELILTVMDLRTTSMNQIGAFIIDFPRMNQTGQLIIDGHMLMEMSKMLTITTDMIKILVT